MPCEVPDQPGHTHSLFNGFADAPETEGLKFPQERGQSKYMCSSLSSHLFRKNIVASPTCDCGGF